jgi:predicted amino acid-binding ACT domain protein
LKKALSVFLILLCVLLLTAAHADRAPWTCPSCGTEGNTGNFCGECGAKAPDPFWTCANCGQEGNDSKFCPQCGAKAPDSFVPQSQAPAPVITEAPRPVPTATPTPTATQAPARTFELSSKISTNLGRVTVTWVDSDSNAPYKVLAQYQGDPNVRQPNYIEGEDLYTTSFTLEDLLPGRTYTVEVRDCYGISTKRTTRAIDEVLPQFDAKTPEALFQAIHLGKHSVKQVANRIQAVLEAPSPEELAERARQEAKRREQEKLDGQHLRVPQNRNKNQGRSKRSSCGVVVKGDPDLLVHLAHCCNPVAGDDILGFITRGRGVSVHRASCPNVRALMENPERLIEVEWDASGASEFQVEMVVEASDRMGLLKDITIAITDAGANILSASTQTTREGVARLRFLVAISDASLLDTLFASISRVPSVFDCRRLMPGEGQNQMKRFV